MRFFYLQEQRVVFPRDHQRYGAKRADAAHADDFQGQVHEAIAVEQCFEVVWQAAAVASKRLLNVGAVALQVDKRMVKNEWRILLDHVSAALALGQRGKVMLGNAALPFFLNALVEPGPDSLGVNGGERIA